MLATYPDVFAGGAILSGLPHRAVSPARAAFSCMNPGSDLTPAQWGDKVRNASTWSGPWPGGRTQLRLRFSSNQTTANYLWIDKGVTAKLTVTYQP